jgi:hypothetical protein
MRTLITTLILAFTLNLSAGEPLKQDDAYCGRMVDGKMTVVYHGAAITSDVKLDDGTVLKPDGNVLRPDGSTFVLKDGECIAKDGKPGVKAKQTPGKH